MKLNPFNRLLGVDSGALAFPLRVWYNASLIVLVAGFMVSMTDLARYDGGDFNLRYIQARCGFAGLDPYRTAADWWWNGIEESFHQANFDGTPRPWGVACQTPAVLLFTMPLALMEREPARWAHGLCEWLAFLGALALLGRVVANGEHRAVVVSASLFFVAGSPFWRLHVERGQYYVFVVLLIAASACLLGRARKVFSAGLLLGAAVAIRPTALFVLVPFFFHRKWRFLAGACCAGGVIGLASLGVFGLSAWESLSWISKKYEAASVDFSSNPFSDCMRATTVPPVEAHERTRKIAGAPLPSVNSTVAGLVRVSKPILDRFGIPVHWVLLAARGVGVSVALLFIAALSPPGLSFKTAKSRFSDLYLVYVGIVAVNLVEYAVPYRAAYADVFYMLPVVLGLPVVLRRRQVGLGVVLLVALSSQQTLLGLVNGWFSIPVRVIGLTLFSLGAALLWRRDPSFTPASADAAALAQGPLSGFPQGDSARRDTLP